MTLKCFGRFYDSICALSMIVLSAVVLYVVVMRYVFAQPPFWGEDVPRTIFLWAVFLAMPLAIHRGLNIRVDDLTKRMPGRVRYGIEIGFHLLTLALIATIFVYSLPIVQLALRGTMVTTGWSNAVLRLPLALGAALMFVAQLGQLAISARAFATARA